MSQKSVELCESCRNLRRVTYNKSEVTFVFATSLATKTMTFTDCFATTKRILQYKNVVGGFFLEVVSVLACTVVTIMCSMDHVK